MKHPSQHPTRQKPPALFTSTVRRRRRRWHRGGGLRGRLTRMFALTAILAVILTTAMTVGATFQVLDKLSGNAASATPQIQTTQTQATQTQATQTPVGQAFPHLNDSVWREAGQSIVRSAIRSALLSALLAVIIAGLVTRQLTRPLLRLAEGAERLGAGERQLQLPVPRRNDELRDLTVIFNDLTTNLARQEAWRRGLIADIAHDLRTPLAVLRSEIEAIQDGVQPADAAALGRLHGEVLLLARLVTDLRLLSLAESGALPLTLQAVNAGEMLHALAAAYARRAAEAGVTITVQTSPDIDLKADPDRLRQTLQNLLDNALRYAAPGAVELSAEPTDQGVRLTVRDHGPGFAPDALSRAFERFYRADASRTRDPQGRASSGLGLAIARALTEAQGGKLSARNHPNGGAEFSLSLPAASMQGGPSKTPLYPLEL